MKGTRFTGPFLDINAVVGLVKFAVAVALPPPASDLPRYSHPTQSQAEARGYLALLASPESDPDLAYSMLTSGNVVNACFGRGQRGDQGARRVKAHLRELPEQHHRDVVKFYKAIIVELNDYHESLYNWGLCDCCARPRLKRRLARHILAAQMEYEQSLVEDSSTGWEDSYGLKGLPSHSREDSLL
ncbi:unnamed protein product [Chrysoparadoxa australica]